MQGGWKKRGGWLPGEEEYALMNVKGEERGEHTCTGN
jgi:hypothetical protein